MSMPLAARWFRRRPISSTVTRIDEPHVDPLVRANIWHVRGRDRDVVIDTGLGVASLRRLLPHLFERSPIVVLTHAHLDHMGGAHEFDGCWAHPGEDYETPLPGSLLGIEVLAELGTSERELGEAVREMLIDAVPTEGYPTHNYRVRPARISHWVHDGERIDLGDKVLTLLHLPGHSPASLAVFDEGDGTLFSGDVVYDDPFRGADLEQHMITMRRLRDLTVSVVHDGHGDSYGRVDLLAIIDDFMARAHTRFPRP